MSTAPHQLKKYKINFYKNGKSGTGAQALAIQNRKEDEIVVKSWLVNGQLWGCTTPDQFLTLLADNKGLYEMLTQYPYKVFFDIDNKNDNVNFEAFTSHIKEIVEEHFPGAEMAISGSHHPTKTSLHIVVNNYLVRNEKDRDALKSIVKVMHSRDSSFDPCVYKTNGSMKCINQMKYDDKHKRVQAAIENDDLKAHCITCFFKEDANPMPQITEEVKEVVKIERLKTKFDLTTLPKLNLRVPREIDLAKLTAFEILMLLPISAQACHDHNYTYRVGCFSKANGIEFESFWSWIEPKHIEKGNNLAVEKKRWEYNWSRLDRFPPVSIETMYAILAYTYPEFLKDRFFKNFENTFKILDAINVEKLEASLFDSDKKIISIMSTLGSGKTYGTVKFLKKNKHDRLLWICPNRALVSNVYNRLHEDGIDIKNYQAYPKKTDKIKMREAQQLILCLNSMHHLEPDNAFAYYDIVVIDEIETLLNKFVDNDFMKTVDKFGVWKQLIHILNYAKKVIFLDAFMTQKTMNFVKMLRGGDDSVFYNNTQLSDPRTVIFYKHHQILINKILEDLRAGKKVFIFYAFKTATRLLPSMEAFHKLLEEQAGVKGKYINADKDDEELNELKDVNKSWADSKFIITNNKITVGVNYDREDFDEEYMFVANYNSPRDVIQVSFRARKLLTGRINVCYVGSMRHTTAWKTDTHLMNCPIYTKLIDDVLTEQKAPVKESFQLFCKKAHFKMQNDEAAMESDVKDDIDKVLKNASIGFSYHSVEDIDAETARYLNTLVLTQEASMMDKIQLQKYFFRKQFNHEATQVNIRLEEGEKNMIQHCWEERDLFLFKRFKTILMDPKNIFNKIREFNNLGDTIFLEDIKQLKLNPEIVEDIFKQFKFKYLTPKSTAIVILKAVYNTYFSQDIIVSRKPASKSHTYVQSFANFDEISQKFAFAKAYMTLEEKDACLFADDSDVDEEES